VRNSFHISTSNENFNKRRLVQSCRIKVKRNTNQRTHIETVSFSSSVKRDVADPNPSFLETTLGSNGSSPSRQPNSSINSLQLHRGAIINSPFHLSGIGKPHDELILPNGSGSTSPPIPKNQVEFLFNLSEGSSTLNNSNNHTARPFLALLLRTVVRKKEETQAW
jgi:hypothetical protein